VAAGAPAVRTVLVAHGRRRTSRYLAYVRHSNVDHAAGAPQGAMAVVLQPPQT
jgi:hypothetical protein